MGVYYFKISWHTRHWPAYHQTTGRPEPTHHVLWSLAVGAPVLQIGLELRQTRVVALQDVLEGDRGEAVDVREV